MKKTLRKMIAMMSAMIMTFGCMMTIINTIGAPAEAAAAETETYEYSEAIEEMAVKFNEARTEMGLDPIYIVPCLNEASQVRAEEQSTQYSHYRPDGTFFDTVIDVDKVDYYKAGEILARGSENVDAIFEAWKNSPTHWENITNAGFTHMGISLVHGMDSEGRETWYWAAIFVEMWEKTDVIEGQRMPEAISNVPEEHSDEIICIGDVSGDEIVDTFDLILIARFLEGKYDFNEVQLKSADVYADGVINETDILVVRRYILGQYSTLPVAA